MTDTFVRSVLADVEAALAARSADWMAAFEQTRAEDARTAAGAQAREAAERAAAAETREQALLAEHALALDEARAAAHTEVARLEAERAAELNRLQAEHDLAVGALHDEIARLVAAAESRAEELRADHDSAVAALHDEIARLTEAAAVAREAHRAEIDALREAHDLEMTARAAQPDDETPRAPRREDDDPSSNEPALRVLTLVGADWFRQHDADAEEGHQDPTTAGGEAGASPHERLRYQQPSDAPSDDAAPGAQYDDQVPGVQHDEAMPEAQYDDAMSGSQYDDLAAEPQDDDAAADARYDDVAMNARSDDAASDAGYVDAVADARYDDVIMEAGDEDAPIVEATFEDAVDDVEADRLREGDDGPLEVRLDAGASPDPAPDPGVTEAASATGSTAGQVPAEASQRPRPRALERMRDAMAQLDEATSLKDALDRLSDVLAQHVARSMVFIVRGDWLRGWRFSGFGEDAPAADAVVLAIEHTGEFRSVIEQGGRAEVHPSRFAGVMHSLAFAHLEGDATGVAVPVRLGGKTAAVLYVDEGEPGASPTNGAAEAVEILARHASRCLEAITATRSAAALGARASAAAAKQSGPAAATGQGGASSTSATGPEAEPTLSVVQAPTPAAPTPETLAAAERFAAIVVSEIKLYNEAAINMGRKKRDLRTRLHAEIDRARGLFGERMGGVPGHEAIFERELVRVLAAGDPELLGKPRAEAV